METKIARLTLTGLAHDTRLAIIRLLVPVGPEGLSAGALGEQLGLAPATLSFHLKELRHTGLVSQRRTGRTLFYAAQYAAINDLVAYLTENCCQGAACLPAVVAMGKPASKARVTRPRKIMRRA
ncbi:MAG TPA: metalloregulator ArsR/SmtB family transcription factor [Gammaproteobacteria bacterium]|nr:metalloregulator ArsR/SmtB family transcription factor [Gammaproteobacteria bacterium]